MGENFVKSMCEKRWVKVKKNYVKVIDERKMGEKRNKGENFVENMGENFVKSMGEKENMGENVVKKT